MAGTNGRSRKKSAWVRLESFLAAFNRTFTYIIGLPLVGLLGTLLAAHFQYVSAYQDKVREVGKEQIAAAEKSFTDASNAFSEAITLQQILFFSYRDAYQEGQLNQLKQLNQLNSLEAKSARVIYPKYVEDRTALREKIDLLAREVEMHLDWASNTQRDAANAGAFGADAMSRIALGAYDFDCDTDMPSFSAGSSSISLDPPPDLLRENPKAKPLGIDWYSAKHELLTLYFCFDKNHDNIATARRWAAETPADDKTNLAFAKKFERIEKGFDNEAVRLHDFLTLAARRIDLIRVKFRPRAGYCHVPLVRQLIDLFSDKCTPIRTAQNAEAS